MVAPASGQQPAETSPDWLKKPKPEDLLAVWPKGPMKTGRGGLAVISCKVSVHGGLFECKVLSEKPEGLGFGGAALALTPQFIMKPATLNGEPVVSTVRIPIKFPEFTPSRSADDFFSSTVISNVAWNKAPTFAEVAAAYPAKGREQGLSGHATLDCRLKDGRLAGCNVLTETPKNAGFGAAAKSLAKLFEGPATIGDGKSTNGMKIQVPFAFSAKMLDAADPVIGKPEWTGIPDDQAFQAAFPKAALDAGVRTGRIRLTCLIVEEGAVEQCAVTREEPEGLGFGAAALSLTGAFRVGVWTDEGLPTIGGKVTIPIRYQFVETAESTAIRVVDAPN